jgi:hypothetical protein
MNEGAAIGVVLTRGRYRAKDGQSRGSGFVPGLAKDFFPQLMLRHMG